MKGNPRAGLWGALALAGCLLRGLSAHAYTNLAGAYAAIGFDPFAPGNAAVVFFSDAHMNLEVSQSGGVIITTNLNAQLVQTVNAMNPPPAKIIFGGDAATSLSQAPGQDRFGHPGIVADATNEMAYFLSALGAFTNVARSNLVCVPGNHDQGPYETNAELWCRMFGQTLPYQSFDLAGVRFLLLNSGNYDEPSDSQRAWLGQQLAATAPTQTVAVVEHIPPFVSPAIYRGMGAMLGDLFANWPARWWALAGHTHGEWEEVYNVGLSNVGALTVGTANTNMCGGLTPGGGFEVLCLSNGIVGAVYYHYDTASFDPIYMNGSFPGAHSSWRHPCAYVPAFTDVKGLLWRRLKSASPAPEVLLATNTGDPSSLDAIDWYAYPTEIQWQLPLGRHANQATHFLCLIADLDARARLEFSADRTDWLAVPFPAYTSDAFAIPIPADIARLRTAYARFLAPYGACVFIGGWGLSSTNSPPLVTYPQLAGIPDQETVAGRLLTITNLAIDPYSPPDRLNFSLLSAPTGATEDAQSGVFTWRPAPADAPQAVAITLKVADTGTPEMSATQQFWAWVELPTAPGLEQLAWRDGRPVLMVHGPPDLNYTVWASTDLHDWTPLYTTNPPAMPFSVTDPEAASRPRRFYRAAIAR